MSLIKELEQYGLDNKKARTYLATLELGTAKANDIAKKAEIERPTTYDNLRKLSREGLVSVFSKKGVRYYIAEDPVKIKKQLQEKELYFDELLPELQSLYNTLKSKPKIKFYEGIEGVKTIFEDTLTVRNKKLHGILSMADLCETPGKQFMDMYISKRVKAGIRLYVMRSRPKEINNTWITDPNKLREVRYVPEKMIFAMTIYIYDNKVSLISTHKENFGMIIESEEFTQNMSHMFTALWQVSTSDQNTC